MQVKLLPANVPGVIVEDEHLPLLARFPSSARLLRLHTVGRRRRLCNTAHPWVVNLPPDGVLGSSSHSSMHARRCSATTWLKLVFVGAASLCLAFQFREFQTASLLSTSGGFLRSSSRQGSRTSPPSPSTASARRPGQRVPQQQSSSSLIVPSSSTQWIGWCSPIIIPRLVVDQRAVPVVQRIEAEMPVQVVGQ